MAKMPAASAAPPPDMGDDTDTEQTDGAAGADDQGDDEPVVICTVMGHKDGSFTLIQGDEDDSEEGGEGDEAAAGAAPAPGAAGGEEGAQDQGQSFTDVGSLLKGVMESVKEFQSESGGSSDQQNFEAGFAGADSTGPASPPMPGAKAA
jgi:hypothetical protein